MNGKWPLLRLESYIAIVDMPVGSVYLLRYFKSVPTHGRRRMKMVPTKVVIADDHTLFREGIKRMLSLEKDILVVGEASRGDEVTKLVERTKPDVLLLDLKMPKGDIVQTLLEVKDINPAAR